jgi:hypothetical protein
MSRSESDKDHPRLPGRVFIFYPLFINTNKPRGKPTGRKHGELDIQLRLVVTRPWKFL